MRQVPHVQDFNRCPDKAKILPHSAPVNEFPERNVRSALAASVLCLTVSGCANSLVADQDRNVASALPYDSVDCATLLAERDQLAQRYNLSINAKPVFARSAMGLGPVTPDIRSNRRRDVEKASGEINAMNRSLSRRKCDGAVQTLAVQ